MPTKEQFHTRLDEDDAAALEEYQDSRNLTTAEAVRRLIQAGLEAETEDEDTPGRGEIAEDLDEVRASVRGIRDDLDEDGQVHRMRQMSAKRIGTLAIGIGVVAAGLDAATVALSTVGLAVLGLVGLALIGYGLAPLLDTTTDDDGTPEVDADA